MDEDISPITWTAGRKEKRKRKKRRGEETTSGISTLYPAKIH
jgi:hypothetical protein